MLGSLSVLLLALRLAIGASTTGAADFDKCYDPKQDFYPYLSTRTAYQLVHGNISRPESTCTPVQIWMLARHGTRYPGKGVIPNLLNLVNVRDQIIKNHEQGAGRLCPEDLENLRNWRLNRNVNLQMADLLAPQGKEDLYLLGKRLQSAFPELLAHSDIFNPEDYIFRATNTQRTQASMTSFGISLFGNENLMQREPPPLNDTLLLPHQSCPAWDIGFREDNVNGERDKFSVGPEAQGALERISKRLGYLQKLNIDSIKEMYDMCRFELAWNPNKTSTWCTIFSKEDLKILEYREDLGYYYCCGPGREISGKLGCEMLNDMFYRFKNLEKGNFTNQPKGIFYFSHTLALQNLMAALKIDKVSSPFLSTTYSTSGNRNFRTSLQGPFATNVIAVFYRCDDVNMPNKVMFYVAEKLVHTAGCKNGLCDWEYLKQEFGPDVEQCNLNFCQRSPMSNNTKPMESRSGDIKVGFSYLTVVAISLVLHSIWLMNKDSYIV